MATNLSNIEIMKIVIQSNRSDDVKVIISIDNLTNNVVEISRSLNVREEIMFLQVKKYKMAVRCYSAIVLSFDSKYDNSIVLDAYIVGLLTDKDM